METKSTSPSLSLEDNETIPWTKHKENVQLLGCISLDQLAKTFPDKQQQLLVLEEAERAVASLATKDPQIAKQLQDAADEKLFRDKAKRVWACATAGKYDECMELISGESNRLINIAYDGLIFNLIRDDIPSIEEDTEELGKLLDEWIAKVGPYKVHCQSLHYAARTAGNVTDLLPYFLVYESKKVQSREPLDSRILIKQLLRSKQNAKLIIELSQKWNKLSIPFLTEDEKTTIQFTADELDDLNRQILHFSSEELDKLHPGRIRSKDGNEALWSVLEFEILVENRRHWWE